MIKVGQFWVVYESVTMEAINPEYLSLSKEEILDYIKKHPKPEDPEYTEDDMIGDLTESSGFYCLPRTCKEETREYVAQLLNDLI